MGHTHSNASVNTGLKVLLFKVFTGQKKERKREREKG